MDVVLPFLDKPLDSDTRKIARSELNPVKGLKSSFVLLFLPSQQAARAS